MDDKTLFRFKPGYETKSPAPALDWTAWGGFDKAVEMCNNNGHCRKFDAGTMCPSYRVTRDEQHLTRGRANTFRLALSGQLGPDSDAMVKEALDLCVSCKGCKRECPTGVDMARMKIEFLAQYRKSHSLSLRDRAVAYLPRYAPSAAALAPLSNLALRLFGGFAGFTNKRALPEWRSDRFLDRSWPKSGEREVVILVDTFNRYFEPENVRAAIRVLQAAGYRVHTAEPAEGVRPLCCGRTFLSAGLVDEARAEAKRVFNALAPWLAHGVPIIGLEPSCLFTLRDEYRVMLPGTEALAKNSLLFEEFLANEASAGRLKLNLKAVASKALLHGHCHQKAYATMGAVERALRLVPQLDVRTIESSCCGMAGSFGYEAEHYEVSMEMGEASLLPAVREASAGTLIVADGTSCRHQIEHGAKRQALHVARVLERALA
jgi:Fe-S oxidoreductase